MILVQHVSKKRLTLVLILCMLLSSVPSISSAQSTDSAIFLHPGILYTAEDLALMKDKVAKRQSPWHPEWQLMQTNRLAQPDYSNAFYSTVYRNDPVNSHKGNADLQNSSSAALMLAIEWSVTGDRAYADAALRILNGWSGSLKSIQGRDAQLAASLYGYKLLNAAEIMRYSDAGWTKAEIDRFTSMMINVFYPLTRTYGYVNGGWANGNWDAADVLFNMSLGIWSDNEEIYNEAVDYFKHGYGNGSVIHYVQNEEGQLQESGRDQAHAQLGLGLLTMAAEIGYTQRSHNQYGADMVSYPNETYPLVKAAEYTAKYNLGNEVPYTPIPGVGYTLEDMGKGFSWLSGLTISPKNRGQHRPMYEQIWHLFRDEVGIPESKLKFTKEAINSMPVGIFYYDHPSFGGLLDAQYPTAGPVKMTVNLQSQSKVLKDSATGTLAVAGDSSTPLAVTGKQSDATSSFEAVYLDANRFVFRSLATRKYLTVTNDGMLLAAADRVGNSETFAYTDTGNGNGVLQALVNGRYLTLNPVTYVMSASELEVKNDFGRWILLYPGNAN